MSGFAIRAFVGPNGGGKTLAMVERVILPAWERGRPAVANFRLYPERLGYSPDLYVPLVTWRQIPDLSECVLALDEISSVLPSRQYNSVPAQLVRVLNQLRKGDVQLGWTAPNWNRCDVLLREVTQLVTVCVGRLPDRFVRQSGERMFPRAQRDDEGRRVRFDRGWPPNRWFRWTSYDALEFDEFTYSAVKDVRPTAVMRYWRSKHRGQIAYDTLQSVGLLDHLDDVGVCVNCGGSRSRPKCSCVPVGGPTLAPVGAKEDPTPPTTLRRDGRNPLGPIANGRWRS